MDTFYDTHAHLDFEVYQEDLSEVLDRAEAAGIRRILTIGCDLASSARAVGLAERYPQVYAVVGWHPGHVEEAPPDVVPDLLEWVKHPKVVAVGECGLDYYRLSEADPSKQPGIVERQKRAFIQQLELAADAGLNCIIHQRAAWEDTMEIWAPFSDRVRAVFHCFVGTPEEADQVIQRGGSVSFTGITTFKSAETVRRTLAAVPSDRYFLETDCPFLAPTPYRGKRCEPAYVLEIAQEVARVRGTTLDQVSQETCANVHRFFDRLTR